MIDKEMTFGTDPVQSLRVLDDPPFLRCMPASSEMARALSISTITARWRAPGSTMNQSHAKADGWHMETGSILGMYRFDLNQPQTEPEPKVISKKTV